MGRTGQNAKVAQLLATTKRGGYTDCGTLAVEVLEGLVPVRKTLCRSRYCFVVEDSDRKSVLLEVRPHDGRAKQHYLGVWQKMAQVLQKRHQIVGTTAPEWIAGKTKGTHLFS